MEKNSFMEIFKELLYKRIFLEFLQEIPRRDLLHRIIPLKNHLENFIWNKFKNSFKKFFYVIFFQVFKAAQPALLYLVPFTLLPLFVMAYLKGDLKTMWHEPFAPAPASTLTTPLTKYQDI